ncbi:unnamed protein product [Adineta steineri]|uniref:Cytochrome P450 n=1 Tax=Adineta steineri TaxID=433720 RepID=A0A813W673_9BILA|nr:unnamed protein product [Adineta steineri]CAF1307811.1 unnamed protein product [Adineta steineri]CAF1308904.1 unnamed protein product [Adineta steineri]
MIFILIFVTVILLIFYFKQKYFTFHGSIPGLSPHFLFGNLLQSGFFKGESPPYILTTFRKRFGDIFQFWFGPFRFIIVNNITDVEHIFTHRNIYDQGDIFIDKFSISYSESLISTKGSKFKRHISLTLPLFRRGKIISNLDLIIDCTDKLLSKWRKADPKLIHIDIVDQCQNLLLAIFGFIGFNYDLETLNDESISNDIELTQALRDVINSIMPVLYLPRLIAKIYVNLNYRQRRARKVIEQYIYKIIEHEQETNPELIVQRKRTCLISSLVGSLQRNEKLEAMKNEEQKKGLSRSEVVDEMVAFLVAGFESTSSVLAWFIYLMSKHPEVQQKIKTELMNNNSRQHISLDHLDSLIYLDCVINEVLRFMPPATGTIRTLTMDDRLPATNVQLFKGESVMIPFYNLAHDTRYWSIDPEIFYPERFLAEDKNHHLYALIPFGGGHRQCIGQDLARFELKVITARLMQYVTFSDGGPQANTGGHSMRLAILPKHVGVFIDFD